MMSSLDEHLHALQESYDDAVAHDERPPIIANVPVDEPPAYVPPASAVASNALIPDTPLVSSTLNPNSLAFDDAPLWQS